MCGIVGTIAERNVAPLLIEGLKRLEYRGYDSAGIAIIDNKQELHRLRRIGKVNQLAEALKEDNTFAGKIGIAHTRWATHGAPTEQNAHPHFSHNEVALVHNGIIENHEELRTYLISLGYEFTSQTDTEVIVHLLHHKLTEIGDLASALKETVKDLEGAYGLAAMCIQQPDRIVAARSGSPLVIGLGIGENFLASDQLALRQVTDRFIYLEEGDIAEITRDEIKLWNKVGQPVKREVIKAIESAEAADKGEYRHFMLKEIYEQPNVIQATLDGRIVNDEINLKGFGPKAEDIFKRVKNIQIVACGTSYHAGLVARYWLEALVNIPCQVEVASEFRYRRVAVQPDTLLISISQSGETADTLAALRNAFSEPPSKGNYLESLTICNNPTSSLVRESGITLLTKAGPEIGVASTKAFTTQLTALLLLTLALGKVNKAITHELETTIIQELRRLPNRINEALASHKEIEDLAESFTDKHSAIFLGRGANCPVAMEGALKLKEISYIHAESYPAGELKHGPLALVDNNMPVIAIAPNNGLLEKLKSNLQEVRARDGELFIFADKESNIKEGPFTHVVHVPHTHDILSPILYTIPLQLLSYYVAILKGTDVDQPRNLAKSVTVE